MLGVTGRGGTDPFSRAPAPRVSAETRPLLCHPQPLHNTGVLSPHRGEARAATSHFFLVARSSSAWVIQQVVAADFKVELKCAGARWQETKYFITPSRRSWSQPPRANVARITELREAVANLPIGAACRQSPQDSRMLTRCWSLRASRRASAICMLDSVRTVDPWTGHVPLVEPAA